MYTPGKHATPPPEGLSRNITQFFAYVDQLSSFHEPQSIVETQPDGQIRAYYYPTPLEEKTGDYPTPPELIEAARLDLYQVMPQIYEAINGSTARQKVAKHPALLSAMRAPLMANEVTYRSFSHYDAPVYDLTMWQADTAQLHVERTTITMATESGIDKSWAITNVHRGVRFFDFTQLLSDGHVMTPGDRQEMPLLPIEDYPNEVEEAVVALQGLVSAEARLHNGLSPSA